jgi:polar amino acid transport system substrate-binding protein
LCTLALGLLGIFPAPAQKQVTALAGLALTPYIIQDRDCGIEVDILRQALALSGYTVKLEYVPFARVPVSIRNREADCALTINEASGIPGVFYSRSHVRYQNVAIALRSSHLRIASMMDLKRYKVIAFQEATSYLGPAFREVATADGTGYSEMANQDTQVKMLFSGRTDVVVMDINIFKYIRQAIRDVDVSPDVDIFPVFKPTRYKIGFIDPALCDRFNEGLARLRASGKYNLILKHYIK